MRGVSAHGRIWRVASCSVWPGAAAASARTPTNRRASTPSRSRAPVPRGAVDRRILDARDRCREHRLARTPERRGDDRDGSAQGRRRPRRLRPGARGVEPGRSLPAGLDPRRGPDRRRHRLHQHLVAGQARRRRVEDLQVEGDRRAGRRVHRGLHVAPGLDGKARLSGGGGTGSFDVIIDDEPPDARVDDDGNVVRSKSKS